VEHPQKASRSTKRVSSNKATLSEKLSIFPGDQWTVERIQRGFLYSQALNNGGSYCSREGQSTSAGLPEPTANERHDDDATPNTAISYVDNTSSPLFESLPPSI
jgi:hypothetical protein